MDETPHLMHALRAALAAAALPPDAPLVVAVSGGPDSLALLHALALLRPHHRLALHVAHFDHTLRGEHSAADASFVAETAAALGLPHTIGGGDVRALALRERRNLSAAARQARYAFLADVAAAIGAPAIATGHTADDRAETLLLHLLRGTGSDGLSALPYDAPLPNMPSLRLLRPLLGVLRAETAAFCAAHGLAPRHDPSNDDRRYARSRIRHELVPRLSEYNPSIVAALGQTAALLEAEHDLIERALDASWPALVLAHPGGLLVQMGVWRGLHLALRRAALRRAHRWLAADAELSFAQTEAARELLDSGRQAALTLAGGVTLRLDGETALLGAPPPVGGPQIVGPAALEIPGSVALADGRWIAAARRSRAGRGGPDRAFLRADALAAAPGGLSLRARQPGDRYRQAGAPGSRRLQDILTDARVPAALRDGWPVVLCGAQIAWVPWARPAHGLAAADGEEDVVEIEIAGTV